jgi:hypothetical protein
MISPGLTILTIVHVALSLAGIFSGFVVLYGLITAHRLDRWTAFFLATTVATSVTGFLFPITGITPAIVLGVISLIVLAIALVGRYCFQLAGAWRPAYVVGAVMAQYLNVFVLIAQLFLKVPALNALAPNGSEPPFLITQSIVLAIFVVFGVASVIRFRAPAVGPALTFDEGAAGRGEGSAQIR